MRQITHTVKDALGIHARPAGLLVRLCSGFQSQITVQKGTQTGDGKKIFSIMALSVKCDEEITVTLSGADENEAAALEQFLAETL